MRNFVQTADRGLRILQSFEDDGDARSVSEIASRGETLTFAVRHGNEAATSRRSTPGTWSA